MEFRGTPGPWVISGTMTKYVEARIDGGMIQEVAAIGPTAADNGYGDQQVANARLIAAAPDLLEALENLLWHAEQLEHLQESERGKGQSIDELYEAGEMHPYMINAKSLIARATGEQK